MFDEELGLLFDRAKVLGFDLEGCVTPERFISSSLTRRSCRQANLRTALGAELI